jgi:hypothetical protein
VKIQDLHGACGFIVFGTWVGRLCDCIAALPGVAFTKRRWLVWGCSDERAEFTFHGVIFVIACDWEGDYWVKPKQEATSPCEIVEIRNHVANWKAPKSLIELIKSYFAT